MNKKILASLIIIGILGFALGWGTYSYFSDTETSTGNTFQAGTLDLKVNDFDDPVGAVVTLDNMCPCQFEEVSVKLTNVGSQDGIVYIHITNVVDSEPTPDTEPEKKAEAPSFTPPTIDGVIDPGEWDSFYLGTSVTNWEGGMSVDVYGVADDEYLYVAYVADMNQPGWSVAESLGIGANFDFWAPSTAEWPDRGYTHISVYGDGFAQTDGSNWYWPDGWGNTSSSVFTSRGIEYYVGHPLWCTDPNPNVAELKIPLSLLTYAGDDGQIGLGGQYWQYDYAEPFYVQTDIFDISNWILVNIWYDENGNGVWDDGEFIIRESDGWTLRGIESHVWELGTLPAGASRYVYLSFHLKAETGNAYQGDMSTFDIEFTLEQA